jgi:hypothetical protein
MGLRDPDKKFFLLIEASIDFFGKRFRRNNNSKRLSVVSQDRFFDEDGQKIAGKRVYSL